MTAERPPRHRAAPPLEKPEVYPFHPPFSAFDFVDQRFAGCPTIRRAFSLARATGQCQTLVVEKICLEGLLFDEKLELDSLGFFGSDVAFRISFWKRPFKHAKYISKLRSDDLIGYLIAKKDGRTASTARWHVFESVFRKQDYPYAYVPRATEYALCAGETLFSVQGVLYCQQNGLNKTCAHVALRSILSRLLPDGDISYARINQMARSVAGYADTPPSDGLSAQQIMAILDEFGIPHYDMDYDAATEMGIRDIRQIHPYQNTIYAGVESGYGALLGFRIDDPDHPDGRHIVPIYGHTFNKDTWVSDAENFYFNIGSGAGYIPSGNWTSSFIGHDDNFGSSFCVPRYYVNPKFVDFVSAVYPHGVQLIGGDVSLLALPILSELYPSIPAGNKWLLRLKDAFAGHVPQVVFRPVCVKATKYFDAILKCRDWLGNHENPRLVAAFKKVRFPEWIQVVEVSLPQLFAANERKLGDIVFDASCTLHDNYADIGKSPFLFARLPGAYFMLDLQSGERNRFSILPSSLVSHVPVITEL